MKTRPSVVMQLLVLSFSLGAPSVLACGMHFGFSPFHGMFSGGREAFTLPPPSFMLEHRAVLKTQPGVEQELQVRYEVLGETSQVSLLVEPFGDVEVLSPSRLELDEVTGDVLIRLLPGNGYQTVTLTIAGQQDGNPVRLDRSVFLVNEKAAPDGLASDLTWIENP